MLRGYAKVGVALNGADTTLVDGWTYQRARPLDPATFDERELAAQDFLSGRRWLAQVERWAREGRPAMEAACRRLRAVDPDALTDDALVAHLHEAIAVAHEGSTWHFEQHALCVLVGLFVEACRAWGLADAEVLPLLHGASPASAQATAAIDEIAAALRAAGVRPASLDDVRRASPSAAAALNSYLETHGSLPMTGFDYDAPTLDEVPEIVLASILAALDRDRCATAPSDAVASVRRRVPDDERPRFDELLHDARTVYGLRDDDASFSMRARGLARRASLAIAARLATRGGIERTDHVFALTPDEACTLLLDGTGPARDEIRRRVDERERQTALDPPVRLGDPPSPPALDDLPPTTRRLTSAMSTYMSLRHPTSETPLCGAGIGDVAYTGRAVVAHFAEDAFERLAPGDVLVTTLTTPAFNAVLEICGALVVEDGGILSHAAVMARELRLPAVIGVPDATATVPDGAEVVVDPVQGTVTVVTRA